MEREFQKLSTVLILLLLAGCKAPIEDVTVACILPEQRSMASPEADEEAQAPQECVLPEQAPEANLQVNFTFEDFSIEKEAKLRDAIRRLEIVINSVQFKQAVLNHEYNGEKLFANNDGLSNEEIYQKILMASEELQPGEDEEIDLDLTLYYKNNSVVGYTYPNTTRVWINDKFFTPNSLGKVAGNIAHEWTHKIGFEHDFRNTSRRKYSVPYAVGDIIEELVDSM